MENHIQEKPGRYRWLVICSLLFAVTTINYMDRQVIGLLKPHLQKDLGRSGLVMEFGDWCPRVYGDGVGF